MKINLKEYRRELTLLSVVIILSIIHYINPKGQYLEIKDKNSAIYQAMFHKGTLSYAVFIDEKDLTKGIAFVIWRWEVEEVKPIKIIDKNEKN